MNKNSQSPKLICLTPVKNEAWCLDVFLQCTSLWADHIIIADQGSTDGSKEIAMKYPKVILLENNGEGLDETYRQTILYKAARQIEGPKVLIALDADEIFTGNFSQTIDWKRITHSKPGDVFVFQWAVISTSQNQYSALNGWFQWAFYDDGTPNISKGYIHIARVPWPQIATPNEIEVKDFQVIHLANVNWNRMLSKQRFYAFVIHIKEPRLSVISLNRQYAYLNPDEEKQLPIPASFFDYYRQNGIDVLGSLNLKEPYFWFDEQVIAYFRQFGVSKFKYLDLWDSGWVNAMQTLYEFKTPKSIFAMLLFRYLRVSQPYRTTLIIRAIDKMLKQII